MKKKMNPKVKKKLNPKTVSIGITPTSWWNDDFPAMDIGITFGQCVSEMALAGYEGCSIGHKYPKDQYILKQELELRGLRVSEPWTSTFFTVNSMRDQTISSYKETLGFIKAMGADQMVVAELGHSSHPLPVALKANRAVFSDEQWTALVDGLHELGRIARENDMILCYHHHMGTGVMTRADVDRLMQSTDPELVHLLLDTGHIYFAGDDPLAMTKAYADRIKHVHLKNIRQSIMNIALNTNLSFQEAIECGVFTVPGDPDGCIDFEPIFDVLADHDYEGWLMVEAEQDPANATPLVYARMGRDYIREVTGV